jgi:hypothetical protein
VLLQKELCREKHIPVIIQNQYLAQSLIHYRRLINSASRMSPTPCQLSLT